MKIRHFVSALNLNPSVKELLTRHSVIHDNVTYIKNKSFLETKIINEFLGTQLAVDGLKDKKSITVAWEIANVLVRLQ